MDTVKIKEELGDNVSIQVAVEMPFDIKTIDCPSHKIRTKVGHTTDSIYDALRKS